MAGKNPAPIITHTEIYARAIRTIETEIQEWVQRCEGIPDTGVLKAATEGLCAKLEALKTLYRIESGSDYV